MRVGGHLERLAQAGRDRGRGRRRSSSGGHPQVVERRRRRSGAVSSRTAASPRSRTSARMARTAATGSLGPVGRPGRGQDGRAASRPAPRRSSRVSIAPARLPAVPVAPPRHSRLAAGASRPARRPVADRADAPRCDATGWAAALERSWPATPPSSRRILATALGRASSAGSPRIAAPLRAAPTHERRRSATLLRGRARAAGDATPGASGPERRPLDERDAAHRSARDSAEKRRRPRRRGRRSQRHQAADPGIALKPGGGNLVGAAHRTPSYCVARNVASATLTRRRVCAGSADDGQMSASTHIGRSAGCGRRTPGGRAGSAAG